MSFNVMWLCVVACFASMACNNRATSEKKHQPEELPCNGCIVGVRFVPNLMLGPDNVCLTLKPCNPNLRSMLSSWTELNRNLIRMSTPVEHVDRDYSSYLRIVRADSLIELNLTSGADSQAEVDSIFAGLVITVMRDSSVFVLRRCVKD